MPSSSLSGRAVWLTGVQGCAGGVTGAIPEDLRTRDSRAPSWIDFVRPPLIGLPVATTGLATGWAVTSSLLDPSSGISMSVLSPSIRF